MLNIYLFEDKCTLMLINYASIYVNVIFYVKRTILMCSFCYWPGLTRVDPQDPWPSHFTGSTTRSGFITMAASKVHSQPHISVFGKASKTDFAWQDPLIFAAQPQDWNSWVFLRNSGAMLHCRTVQFFFFFLKNQWEKFSFFSPKNQCS